VLGVVGTYMKRFGWSRPALLIGFVLSKRLDAAVYQSVQVYGATFLERPGVQVMLVLLALSVVLAARMTPHRAALTPDGPYAASGRRPQMVFLGCAAACCAYALYDAFQTTFLARVFPATVAVVTLALLAMIALKFRRREPDYAFYDADRESGEEAPERSVAYYQGWMLALLGAVALAGFVIGMFAYITVFLNRKAGVRWRYAIIGGLAAAAVLSFMSYLLTFYYPGGLLQHLVDMPWPFD
jgi:hypothetical protein